ncbi:MAG TPA: DUF1254 domain-containing protein [Caulobacteraceae bacterium]|jgi:hypothetical protein
MDRRGFLVGGLLAGGAAFAPRSLAASAAIQPEDLRAAAREGWLYGLPLIETARLRTAAIGASPAYGKPGFNSFTHLRDPAGAANADFSAAEADVLYSSAWIHLEGGPAKISLPPTGGRYVAAALFDLYGNVLDVAEGQEAAKNGRDVLVIGPPPLVGVAGYTAPMPRMPAMHKMIHTRGNWVWALVRIHLEGDDLAAAHALQDRLAIEVKPAKKPPKPAQPVPRDAPWSDYFYAVQQLIDENPPPPTDETFFRRIASLQLGMVGGFEKARFADVELAEIAKGAAEGAILAQTLPDGDASAGWSYPKPDLGDFAADFLYRAQIAHTQPGALPPAVMMPIRALGPGGRGVFESERRWRVVLPEALPANGFWSLTLYRAEPDGRLSLVQGPSARHVLSAWSPGLRRRDGWVEVEVGRTPPDGSRTNWLPAPEDGDFALILRAYAPGDGIVTGGYRPPPVEAM